MSDTGLFSSQYKQIHDWAEIVDAILIDLKSGSLSLAKNKGRNLGQLLIDLARQDYNNKITRFMVLHLQAKMELPHKELLKIGNELVSGNFDEEVISFLEKFAQILEQEQIGTMARMWRWTR